MLKLNYQFTNFLELISDKHGDKTVCLVFSTRQTFNLILRALITDAKVLSQLDCHGY